MNAKQETAPSFKFQICPAIRIVFMSLLSFADIITMDAGKPGLVEFLGTSIFT